jgi:hypothetical protein
MGRNPTVRQYAAQMFLHWYKDKKQNQHLLPPTLGWDPDMGVTTGAPSQNKTMKPFIQHFLEKLAPLIVTRTNIFNDPVSQFGKIFEILGTMLCDHQHVRFE